ncbi:putative transcriptional regulatory protein, luxR family [Bradyrhizobium sp. ORS 285]|uniref:helix-turn-helix transcriptional regulator n=1 Tax=Bradyrhizobium sp. ORS 285 TaxID=115808 RepID=UPI0002409581|nr:helix-turn-helix transcriptional regulator [Bradyrhizobium sp. ORS 285]CCD89254.1 putative transcriptional regulatory protein, luxR family [Bradyrhizobium sp. ORS 285]SMX56119.1 putative transcriptional regulatory protein, luxR family [Bradyrhizobium sp. ORS 285]
MHVTESSVIACVGNIYQAAHDPTLWSQAVESLRTLFDGSKACLVRIGPERGPDDLIAPSNDPAFQERYIAEFADEPNIIEHAVARAEVGTAYSDVSFIGRETLRASRLWNDWMAPQDMYGGLTCKLAAAGASTWFFDVQRGRNQTPFDAADLELLGTIAPHLTRALEMSRQARIAQLVSTSLSQLPFALMAVDAGLRILARNEAAEQILSERDSGLSERRSVLVTPDLQSTARLQRLVAESCASARGLPGVGGDLLIVPARQAGDTGALAISVGPATGLDSPTIALEPCAILIARKVSQQLPAGFGEAIARFFELTPQEARVAAAIAAGQSLKQAAELIGIRVSTARTHLARIFDKTGTSQQSQLVALLRSVQVTLPRK